MNESEETASVDWRAMFVKYVDVVGMAEGVSFLYPDDWTVAEQEAIREAVPDLSFHWNA